MYGVHLCPCSCIRDNNIWSYLFCRTLTTCSDEEYLKRIKARVDANDTKAINTLRCTYYDGDEGLTQCSCKTMELWNVTGKLGYPIAHCNIAAAHHDGRGVLKDPKKEKLFHGLSAMGGHATSQSCLGIIEYNEGSINQAMKHWMIVAEVGRTQKLFLIFGKRSPPCGFQNSSCRDAEWCERTAITI